MKVIVEAQILPTARPIVAAAAAAAMMTVVVAEIAVALEND
jgi:hypothetical protein